MKPHWIAVGLIGCVVLGARASAADWYVDAVNGSNANNGTSPATAWRTIKHALANTPTTGQQRVFVAPGRYDEALGETFPIRMRDKLQLIGAGPATTEIVNTATPQPMGFEGQSANVIIRVAWEVGAPNIGPGTLLQGFRLTSTRPVTAHPHPPQGIWFEAYYGHCEAELRDLEIDSTLNACRVYADNGSAKVVASRVDVRSNQEGLTLSNGCQFLGDEVNFIDNFQAVWIGGTRGTTVAALSRSRIEGSYYGIIASASTYSTGSSIHGDVTLDLSDCTLTRNGTQAPTLWAVRLSNDAISPLRVSLRRCTIADNSNGITDITSIADIEIDSCVIQSVNDDLDYGALPSISYSNIADGDFAGSNGNISAPVLFVDAPNGDYRMAFNSPGVDAGNPAIPAGTVDFLGTARPIDGNLDTAERADIGAFEFAPLFRQGSGALGTQLELECWGELGATTTVYFSRRPLAATPLSTPFGDFDLDPTQFGFFRNSAVGQTAPVLVTRMIPNSAFLIGQTFSFQARTSSSSAPAGAAYTNAVVLTIAP